jgi:hypothetical protein
MEVIGYLGNYHRRFRTKMVQKFGYEGFLLQHGVFQTDLLPLARELVWCEKQLDGAAVARRRAAVADVMARHWRHDAIPTVTAAWGAAHAVACSVRLRTRAETTTPARRLALSRVMQLSWRTPVP